MKINIIHNCSAEACMAGMPDSSIDMVLTSPPYDNLREYNGFSFPFDQIAQELYRVVKWGGVVVWVVGDATINGSETGTSFRQALSFMDYGFRLHDTMIYAKNNPIPLTHNRYEQCFEYMFVLSKGKPATFNPLKGKTITFGSCTHRFNTNKVVEGATRPRDEKTITKDTKYRVNIWPYTVGNSPDSHKHPAAFPDELAADHIKSWSNEGDLIYDPFMGSGTTAKMAMLLNRNYIGSEISEEYCAIAEKRLLPYKQQTKLFV